MTDFGPGRYYKDEDKYEEAVYCKLLQFSIENCGAVHTLRMRKRSRDGMED